MGGEEWEDFPAVFRSAVFFAFLLHFEEKSDLAAGAFADGEGDVHRLACPEVYPLSSVEPGGAEGACDAALLLARPPAVCKCPLEVVPAGEEIPAVVDEDDKVVVRSGAEAEPAGCGGGDGALIDGHPAGGFDGFLCPEVFRPLVCGDVGDGEICEVEFVGSLEVVGKGRRNKAFIFDLPGDIRVALGAAVVADFLATAVLFEIVELAFEGAGNGVTAAEHGAATASAAASLVSVPGIAEIGTHTELHGRCFCGNIGHGDGDGGCGICCDDPDLGGGRRRGVALDSSGDCGGFGFVYFPVGVRVGDDDCPAFGYAWEKKNSQSHSDERDQKKCDHKRGNRGVSLLFAKPVESFGFQFCVKAHDTSRNG